jgi:hypothetical protein
MRRVEPDLDQTPHTCVHGNDHDIRWTDVGPGLLLETFLDPQARDAVLTEARAAAGAAATVHGHGRTEAVPRVRHATQLAVCNATRRLVDQRLSDLVPALT